MNTTVRVTMIPLSVMTVAVVLGSSVVTGCPAAEVALLVEDGCVLSVADGCEPPWVPEGDPAS